MPVLSMSTEAARELLEATQFVSWENDDFQEGVSELQRATQPTATPITHKPAPIHQIAVVQIERFGSDVGLFINGEECMTADPTNGDDHIALKATALSLAATLELPICELAVEPTDEWQWNEIQADLIDQGKLMKPAITKPQAA